MFRIIPQRLLFLKLGLSLGGQGPVLGFRVPKWVFGKLGQNWTIRIYTNAPNSNHNPYSMHSL